MKAKRIKRVFTSSSQVYHLWANQSQDNARQGGNMNRAFFEGLSAYSYGMHYEVGRIVTYKGVKVGIVNNTGYSHTTSKHISEAYGALDGLMPRIKATTFNVRDALVEVQGQLIDKLMNHFSRRSFYKLYDPFENKYGIPADLVEFNSNCRILKHSELQLEITEEFIQLSRDHVNKCVARAEELKSPEYEAKREAKRRAQTLKDLEKNKEDVEAWKKGSYSTEFIRSMRPMLIRISGDTVQTSNGATVKLTEAMQLLTSIESKRVKKDTQIGSFKFDSIKDGIVKIGCHTFDLNYVKEVLKGVK